MNLFNFSLHVSLSFTPFFPPTHMHARTHKHPRQTHTPALRGPPEALLCFHTLPNLTCVTFRVFSSLECDWKRKTMHWSSLDSVLLSALQRKHVRERGRRKINHIYIILSGWVKGGKKDITPLSGCHAPTGLATPCLFGSGLCKPTEHVQSEGQSNSEVQLSSSNLWVQGQMRTINGNIKVGGRSKQTNRLVWHTGKRQPSNSQQPPHTHTANIRADKCYQSQKTLFYTKWSNPKHS